MIKEIEAKSLLIYNKKPSSWFAIKYYFNPYRGCTSGCIYCDSRSDCYKITNFDKDVEVKINTPKLLKKELLRKRSRDLLGFGSTSDVYMPIEKKYEITKQCLEIARDLRFPIFILTKYSLVLRDIEIIHQKSQQNYACVAFSISTLDDELASFLEPNATKPSERLKAMSILSVLGIKVGVVLMPVLPFITDNEDNIKNIVNESKKHGASFIYASFGVTLRDSQRDYFYKHLDIDVREKYEKRFKNSYYCSANYKKLKFVFDLECKKVGISNEMPSYDSDNSVVNLFNLLDL